MPINFPDSPSTNDTYTFNGRTWKYNGEGWEAQTTPPLFADGSVSAPSLAFTNDTNTGLYRIADDRLGVTTAGTKALEVAADGKVLFGNATDTNLYRSAADTLKTDDALVVGGALNLGTNTFNLRVPPMCRARRAASQAFTSGALGAVNFDTEDFDTDAMFAATRNYVEIKTAGVYQVSATVNTSQNITGVRGAVVFLNPTFSGSGDSATITAGTRITGAWEVAVTGSIQSVISCATLYNFAVSDKVALGSYQTSGSNSVGIDGNVEQTSLNLLWVGQTS